MEQEQNEWNSERIAFVLIFGLIGGIIVHMKMNAPMAIILGPLILASPYSVCSFFFGFGGFKRAKIEDKGFSFINFLMEPLILVVMTLLAFIPVGIIGLIKNCGN